MSDVWRRIEAERRLDSVIRWVSAGAWSVTLLVIVAFGAMVGMEVRRTLRLVDVGVATSAELMMTVRPLLEVVGGLAFVVAILSTVGVFLRFRTASLAEIQVRLANLESALIDSDDRRLGRG